MMEEQSPPLAPAHDDAAAGGSPRRVRRVIVACSPNAGAGDGSQRLEDFLAALTARQIEVVVRSELSAIEQLIARPPEDLVETVLVAAGGDGTLNLIASRADPQLPVMPLPLGTENLVARHYGLFEPGRFPTTQRLLQTLLHGEDRTIDAGMVTFPKARKGRRERMFLIMASVGFDAEVVRRMTLTRRGHIRRWSYFKPILATLRKYRYPPIRVSAVLAAAGAAAGGEAMETTAAKTECTPVAWALVFNMPRYAAGLEIESAAREDDGVLDFCGLTRGSHVQGVRYFLGVLLGRHTAWRDVHRMPVRELTLESDRPLAIQLDGDYTGRLPVRIRLARRRVTLRVPSRQQRRDATG